MSTNFKKKKKVGRLLHLPRPYAMLEGWFRLRMKNLLRIKNEVTFLENRSDISNILDIKNEDIEWAALLSNSSSQAYSFARIKTFRHEL